MWPGLRSQTVPCVGHTHAAFLGSFVFVLFIAIAIVCFCYAIVEAYWADRCGGGADRIGGSVVHSVSLELPISDDTAEVLAEPAKDGGNSLGIWWGFGTPCIC